MATEHSYHKFNPVDMPQIRALRSEYIRGFRLKSKVDRLDKITKAILPDIDWNKIGVKSVDVEKGCLTPEITDLESEISTFRDILKSKLETILCCISEAIINDQGIWEDEPDEHLSIAAREMAHKYHQKSTKAGRRHQRNSKVSKKGTENAQTRPTPPSKSPSKLSSKSPPRAQQVTRPSPVKCTTNTHQTTQGQPTTYAAKAPNSPNSQSMPTKDTTQKAIRGAVNASTKSNIKTHFKTIKTSNNSTKATRYNPRSTNRYSVK